LRPSADEIAAVFSLSLPQLSVRVVEILDRGRVAAFTAGPHKVRCVVLCVWHTIGLIIPVVFSSFQVWGMTAYILDRFITQVLAPSLDA